LKRRKWEASELRARAKGGPEKVALAARLRAETMMTVGWIAERLGMGTRGHLNHLLYRRRKSCGEKPISRTDPKGTQVVIGHQRGEVAPVALSKNMANMRFTALKMS
jgi:hypothetical protein